MTATRSLRFIIVGVSAALLHLLLSYVFMRAGLQAGVAVLLASLIAFICAYLVQKLWTFESAHSHVRTLPRYLAVQLFCAFLAALSGELSHQVLGWSDMSTALLSTVVASATAFVLSSRWAFAD